MREYKTAKGYAIAIYIFAPLLIALFTWVLVLPFIPRGKTDPSAAWILIPVALAMITLMVIGMRDAAKSRVVIDHDRVYTSSTFTNRELFFKEIKGYRINDKFIIIESNQPGKKNIKINNYFSGIPEIKQWLASSFPDLDAQTTRRETEEILTNDAFGLTTEDREYSLQRARRAAKITNIAGAGVGAWSIFYPHPYPYALLAALVMPFVTVAVLKYFRGLIRINKQKGSAYPSVFIALLFPFMALFLRAVLDFNIFSYTRIWAPAAAICLLFTALLFLGSQELKMAEKAGKVLVVSMMIFIFMYAYGAVVTLNYYFDTSQPQHFRSTVLSKRISTGKSTTYYLELSPWGPQVEADEVTVSSELYHDLLPGDAVNIYFRKGAFDIPWFDVSE